ncbi:Rpn family recombination-promoting nuclease/putative transposase [Janthinobacterium fluminis]|uniref:Rpn family recombination-promoting nuclease/putative transposase n=1 Tax=Janthinobacterium fluminis TaxID=2987524 RepID=A0ABT5K561_9BURK|nr:Rpn family recombination-promoting nuclease/putative transposase [Janthinobacterium fluminis]MDC8760130.1 Rpn family recombination-promoting nuclease/putative transposase [Janthinobacterium fluminis]
MADEHDSGYKQLFAHPEVVRELLAGFLPYAWAGQLELSAFERVNASYVSDTGRQRHDDMVWRLRLGGEWVYVYILLEFQARNDPWMALRMQVYVGLLCQDLLRRRALTRGGKLAPVLPIVLYNGAARWSASTDLAQLMLAPPEGLAPFQPAQRYLLIDRGSYDARQPGAQFNLIAAIFRLEQVRSSQNIVEVVAGLVEWLRTRECASLRGSLTRWIAAQLRRQLKRHNMIIPDDLSEVQAMLNQTFATLADEWEYAGIQKGRQEGLQEGQLQGDRSRLRFLLQKRFGVLAPAAVAQIEAAPAAQLERWFERLFDASSVEQLLGG